MYPDTQDEEIVLLCRGYIIKAHLPPINSKNQCVPRQVMSKLTVIVKFRRLHPKTVHSYQDITITGLGCKGFDAYLQALSSIKDHFQQSIPGITINTRGGQNEEADPALYFSNRFFTHISQTKDANLVAFPLAVDPFGILRAITGGIHTTDNEVHYFERVDKDGAK